MRKSAVALITALLVTAATLSILVDLAAANPLVDLQYSNSPTISVHSPGQNETLSVNDAPLNFTIAKPGQYGWLIKGGSEEIRNMLLSVNVVLDGTLYRSIEVNSNLSSPFNYSHILANLTSGTHNLTIQTACEGWRVEIHGLWSSKINQMCSSCRCD